VKLVNESKTTATIVAAVLGLIASICTWKGVAIPGDVQPVMVMAVTTVAGFIAPSIVSLGSTYAKPIHAVLTAAAAALSFAVANWTLKPSWLESVLVGLLGFATALFIPSVAHPSRLPEAK
jgi:hypothetical protein